MTQEWPIMVICYSDDTNFLWKHCNNSGTIFSQYSTQVNLTSKVHPWWWANNWWTKKHEKHWIRLTKDVNVFNVLMSFSGTSWVYLPIVLAWFSQKASMEGLTINQSIKIFENLYLQTHAHEKDSAINTSLCKHRELLFTLKLTWIELNDGSTIKVIDIFSKTKRTHKKNGDPHPYLHVTSNVSL